jgi:hypothetical protein
MDRQMTPLCHPGWYDRKGFFGCKLSTAAVLISKQFHAIKSPKQKILLNLRNLRPISSARFLRLARTILKARLPLHRHIFVSWPPWGLVLM